MTPANPDHPILASNGGFAKSATDSLEIFDRFRDETRRPLLQRLPAAAWILLAFCSAWAVFTPNAALTLLAFGVLAPLYMLLWRHAEPPALLFICVYQWLQAAVAIFYVDFLGTSLEDAAGPEFVRATFLSLYGVLALAVGMRVALSRLPSNQRLRGPEEASQLSIDSLFVAYLGATFISFGFKVGAWLVPGLTQLLIAISNVKWVVLFLLLYSILVQQRKYGLAVVVVLLEVFIGMMGFFSTFKGVLFLAVVVLLSSVKPLRSWRLFTVLLTGFLVLALCLVWSIIKIDYRDTLNQGSGKQEVVISVEERVESLGELVSGLTWQKMSDGIETLVLRVSYVTYFSAVLQFVPETVPYENGALWWGTVEHVLKPRLFFPGKAKISDSERTEKYTGIKVAGEEEGTSIGIGYIGESYIDFGPFGMFVPVFFLGALYGFIYRKSAITGRYQVIGFAIASTIFVLGATSLETSNIKLVGGTVVNSIVLFSFARFLGRPLIQFVRRDS